MTDYKQVREMATHMTQEQVADRLGITERHVRRILSTADDYRPVRDRLDLPEERLLALAYRLTGDSYRKVAWRLGRSHEWARKALQRPYAKSAEAA